MTPSTTGSYTSTILAFGLLATSVSNLSVAVTSGAIIVLFILIALAIGTHESRRSFKAPLFTLIVCVVMITTLILGGATVALNANSPTGGPVRWAADFQVWACGNQLDLRDPRGLLTDRIGSPVLFEQNDGRIHFSGTPTNLPTDVTLGTFLQTVGGDITDSSLIFPTNDKTAFIGTPRAPEQVEPYLQTNSEGTFVRFLSGQSCGNQASQVQVFVYQFDEATNTYRQTKITNPANYEISHKTTVPAGDCIIMEFAPAMDHTDHLCQSYGQRDVLHCMTFGVPANKATSCDIQEVKT